jgi:pullulanase/glycogen debranching enzyme
MFDFFRSAIALRHAHPALRGGEFHPLYAKDRQYAFVRRDGAERLLVAVNAADDMAEISIPVGEHIPDGAMLQPLLGDLAAEAVSGGQVTVRIPARCGGVFAC